MTNAEAIKYLIRPISSSTVDGEEKSKEFEAYNMAIKALEQQKTGKWIYESEDWNKWTCSECGWSKRTDVHVSLGYNYCPNCGADLSLQEE